MMDYLAPCMGAFLAGVGFCIIFNVHGKKRIFFHALGGSVGWLAYVAFAFLGSETLQTFIGAVAISIYSEAMARVFKMPAAGYLRVAFIPLVPGGKIYYTMMHCLNGEMEQFGQQLLDTLGVAGCLAMGMLLVSTLVQMMKTYQENQRRKAAQSDGEVPHDSI